MPKGGNGLGLVVLEDGESIALQVGNEAHFLVHCRGVQNDLFDFLFEDENAAVICGRGSRLWL